MLGFEPVTPRQGAVCAAIELLAKTTHLTLRAVLTRPALRGATSLRASSARNRTRRM